MEDAIGFLFEAHPDDNLLKTYTKAVKVLPDHIKATEEKVLTSRVCGGHGGCLSKSSRTHSSVGQQARDAGAWQEEGTGPD